MSVPLPRLHAVYAVTGDADLFAASLASVYPHVAGITVVTGHDRDWMGRPRDPRGVADLVLSRAADPERKIDLVVLGETNEARSRNRAMDLAAPPRASLAVEPQSTADRPLRRADYFLIVDADEIYAAGALERLRAHAARRRLPAYRVAAVRYFKRWNYRIEGHEWLLALLRCDRRLPHLRTLRPGIVRRGLARLPLVPAAARASLLGFEDVPAATAVLHHGTYVGPRERIVDKLASFGHAAAVPPDWIERVWDGFEPGRRDLNPVYPGLFPTARRIAVGELPDEIRDRAWPPGYLER